MSARVRNRTNTVPLPFRERVEIDRVVVVGSLKRGSPNQRCYQRPASVRRLRPPGAIQIVDRFHTKEALHPTAQSIFGTGEAYSPAGNWTKANCAPLCMHSDRTSSNALPRPNASAAAISAACRAIRILRNPAWNMPRVPLRLHLVQLRRPRQPVSRRRPLPTCIRPRNSAPTPPTDPMHSRPRPPKQTSSTTSATDPAVRQPIL